MRYRIRRLCNFIYWGVVAAAITYLVERAAQNVEREKHYRSELDDAR